MVAISGPKINYDLSPACLASAGIVIIIYPFILYGVWLREGR